MRQFIPALRFIVAIVVVISLVSCASNKEALKKKNLDMATNAFQMGTVYFIDGNYLEALKSLTRAVELAPDMADFHNVLALAYGARGLYERAEKHFLKAIELDPMLSAAYVNLSALYMKEKRWDEAIEASRGALKNVFYNTPEFAYNNIGWGLMNKGDYDGAVKNLSKAVSLNPKYKWGFNNLGLALERAGRDEDAVRVYQSALRIDKKFTDAYLNMAILLMKNNEMDAARDAFNMVIETAPDSNGALRAEHYLEEFEDTP